MNYRHIDCTLRDGGNMNNWHFKPEHITHMLKELDRSKIDIIEVGYRGGSGSNKSRDVGAVATSSREFLQSLPVMNYSKLAVMVVPTVCDLANLDDLTDTPVSWVRIAAYPKDFSKVVPFVENLKKLGLNVGVNLMSVSHVSPQTVWKFGLTAQSSGADLFYIADSFGALTPTQIGDYFEALSDKVSIPLGFHGHNNLGLAFSNGLMALEKGASYLDTSLCGMARGAGNLPTEILAAGSSQIHAEIDRYDLRRLLALADFIQKDVMSAPMPLSSKEIECGIFNTHYYNYDKIKDASKHLDVDRIAFGKELKGKLPSHFSTEELSQIVEQIQMN